jgi:nucleoside diphosphate kinase
MSATEAAIEQYGDFGYAMIRPDAIEMGLDEPIIARLEAIGLLVVKRSLTVITNEQVDGLYPKLHNRSYYTSMKEGMVGRKVMSLIISGEQNVAQRLLIAKGSALTSIGSIRSDFSGGHLLADDLRQRFLAGELTATDLQAEALTTVMREDRLHTDETPLEAANSMHVMFTTDELSEAATRFPALASFLNVSRNRADGHTTTRR